MSEAPARWRSRDRCCCEGNLRQKPHICQPRVAVCGCHRNCCTATSLTFFARSPVTFASSLGFRFPEQQEIRIAAPVPPCPFHQGQVSVSTWLCPAEVSLFLFSTDASCQRMSASAGHNTAWGRRVSGSGSAIPPEWKARMCQLSMRISSDCRRCRPCGDRHR